MARFEYVAQDKYRAVNSGTIEGASREEVISLLEKKGLSPIRIDLVAATDARARKQIVVWGGGRLTTLDQITMIRHLGTILNTGTDLLASLDIIANDAIKPIQRKILYDIKERITRGERFSDALGAWQNQFTPIFISLVKAGESSGDLPNILLSYSQELRKDYTFFRKLKGALVYPAILLVALVLMVVLILSFVTPRLKEVFLTTKSLPPWYLRLFFGASDFWLANTTIILIVLGILAFLLVVALRNVPLRRKLALMLWYIPIVNKVQKNLILARFTKTTATLLDAGFPLKSALRIASDVVNVAYRSILVKIAQEKLEKGIAFSQALHEYPNYFPGIMVSVVSTGEKSGQLSHVLRQMAEFYEEEVAYSLELLLTLIEPILLLIVGLIIGLMASSLISPLYRLIGNIR